VRFGAQVPDTGTLDMLKVSMMLIHTIHMNPSYKANTSFLFRGLVIIHLETNRLRPGVRTIQKAHPLAYRAKVLGRALVSARTDGHYAEGSFPSTTISTTTYQYRATVGTRTRRIRSREPGRLGRDI
jgi:hypothetical protein